MREVQERVGCSRKVRLSRFLQAAVNVVKRAKYAVSQKSIDFFFWINNHVRLLHYRSLEKLEYGAFQHSEEISADAQQNAFHFSRLQ